MWRRGRPTAGVLWDLLRARWGQRNGLQEKQKKSAKHLYSNLEQDLPVECASPVSGAIEWEDSWWLFHFFLVERRVSEIMTSSCWIDSLSTLTEAAFDLTFLISASRWRCSIRRWLRGKVGELRKAGGSDVWTSKVTCLCKAFVNESSLPSCKKVLQKFAARRRISCRDVYGIRKFFRCPLGPWSNLLLMG